MSRSEGSVTTMKDLFNENSRVQFDTSGLRRLEVPPAGTLGYYGPAYNEQEKLMVDPNLKRKTWYKTYSQGVRVRRPL
jgi:hypothetical protein